MKTIHLTDIPNISAAHVTKADVATGCTIIVAPKGATGAVDVRGAAPATRETDLLRPEESVQKIHAVMLSGGSAFGLEAASGAMEALAEAGIGLDMQVVKVPLVVGASVFDMFVGSPTWPTKEDGAHAAKLALTEGKSPLDQGNVGGGCGCTIGKVAGPQHCMKSGFGEAGFERADGLMMAAASCVNAMGDVVDEKNHILAGLIKDGQLIGSENYLMHQGNPIQIRRSNTTISCIVTNAKLSKAEATKLAQMSADAYAHTIRPTHTTSDGDAIFVLATGEFEGSSQDLDSLAMLSQKALEQAIRNAVVHAQSAYGLLAYQDLKKA